MTRTLAGEGYLADRGLATAVYLAATLEPMERPIPPESIWEMSEDYAEETLKAVVAWCRFAEIFAYDEADQTFSLEAA